MTSLDFYSDFSKMVLPFLSISWYIVHSDIILVMHPLKSGFYHLLSPVYPGSEVRLSVGLRKVLELIERGGDEPGV